MDTATAAAIAGMADNTSKSNGNLRVPVPPGGGWTGELRDFNGIGIDLKGIFVDWTIMTAGTLLLSRIPGGASVATRVGAPAVAEAVPRNAGMIKGLFGLAP